MQDKYILTQVKSALGITGTYQDNTLLVYINDVKDYLKSAGISSSVIDSDRACGVIARGVADTWDLGSGNGKLSSYFYERVIQLANYRGNENV